MQSSTVQSSSLQLLAAHNVTSSERTLQNLDYVDANDTLSINNGYLILKSNSGKLYEFSGDTTIFIKDVVTYSPRSSRGRFSDISYLRTSQPPKDLKPSSGIFIHPTEIVFPFFDQPKIEVSKLTEFCIFWLPRKRPESVIKYNVVLRNMYGQVFEKFETNDHFIEINPTRYDTLTYNTMIINVESSVDNIFSREIALVIVDSNEINATTCDLRAIDMLEQGLIWEFSRNYPEISYQFFELAAELSDLPIYDSLFQHYKTRH